MPGLVTLMVTFALIAAFSTPIYAICLAHGNDHLRPSQIIPASGAMVFVQNIGILFGVAVSPVSTEILGGRGYPALIAVLAAAMVLIALVRRTASEAPEDSGQVLATAGLMAPQSGQLQMRSTEE
jgi:hypothetical protein